jgi:catechol 2,3-dioxygenase-like lactoylglutathione lyase family enzyme
MRGQMHHIDLTVKDPEESAALYDPVLRFLGYERIREHEWRLEGPTGGCSIALNPAKGPNQDRGHDRYSPGLHHFAWRAASREEVDRFHEHLLRIGATILDAPAEYPQYNSGQGYYAVFFTDPDGLKLEVAFTPN